MKLLIWKGTVVPALVSANVFMELLAAVDIVRSLIDMVLRKKPEVVASTLTVLMPWLVMEIELVESGVPADQSELFCHSPEKKLIQELLV